MAGTTEKPDDARRDATKGAPAKYRDRPTNDGQHGDAGEKPNEGYPDEALDPDAQRVQQDPAR